ncbi:His-Xaa-Ser system radical SAM maturase HxsC [Thioalkalivibrio sp. ALE30]|uniref:His-Xaa-Ser system radical SAM maturase HxsC n=1 Tax=Thioalkalivibrio sp. ALE30 TaxID=1158181 RepID=UPI0018CA43B4|nr:His-Xaa-Ser system radical SAM maturase HxsC [Thioalkalivibrio sp. ALE30]
MRESLGHDCNHQRIIGLDDPLYYLQDKDIVRINPVAQEISVLFRASSDHNSILVTERCNSFCLMCSQPPKDINDSYLVSEACETISLIPRGTRSLGITGGEPTLLGDGFFRIVRQARNRLPETALHVLTNGRRFCERKLARRLSDIGHQDLMLGVPLYSEQPDIHDFVVQAKGAFDETVKGILNLKAEGIRVELRVVLHDKTCWGLPRLAQFIARNLKFVDQVALMGLELTGFTKSNLSALWVDPYDYRAELEKSVWILKNAGIRVLIFNHQLCVLEDSVRQFSVKSISDWKNDYLPACESCVSKEDCGGFFSSGMGLMKHSAYIQPLKTPGSMRQA